MRCFTCTCWSANIFCKACRNTLLVPTIRKRRIGSLLVISFFKYSEIETLILSKYQVHGYRIYKALAKITFTPFIKEFYQNKNQSLNNIYIIGIDESVKSGYSHVALLTHAMKIKNIKVIHASLMAQNSVKYAGKNLKFRLDNPRDFVYKGKQNISAILVDDVVTTGITLQEAQKVLIAHNVNVLFALTLADVKD